MNTLSIDIGNNRIKLDYWADEGIISRTESNALPIDEIKQRVKDNDIKGIIVSSVRKNSEEVIKELKEKSGCDVIINFNQEEISKYRDKIKYKGNVGADRIAAYIGANECIKGAKLIVDAGTAITLDVVDKENNYCGGNISLGLQSRMKALADATSLLPKVVDIKDLSNFGNDTKSAIEDGARNGVIGEILYTIELAKSEYNIDWVFITGGDSEIFLTAIERKWKNCISDACLVGRGLNYHLRKFYFPKAFRQTKFQQAI